MSAAFGIPSPAQFGALPFVYGTLVTSLIGLFVAVPLGFGAAIFLAELAPRRISDGLTFLIDLLAAVPSVIYGLLGIFIVVPLMRTVIQPGSQETLGFLPLFQGPAYGIGFLTAGVVLAVMIVPFIISVSREVLLAVPGISARRLWRSAPPAGRPPGRLWCPTRARAFWALSFWRWRALSAKPWPSPWLSEITPISALRSLRRAIPSPRCWPTNSAKPPEISYLSALMELALVLFLVTFILNGLARILIVLTAHRGSGTAHA